MTPNGTIYVCKDTNLIMNGSDFDTIYFDTKPHKREWFMTKVIKTFNEQMYTRMGSATQGRTLGGEQYATLAEGKIRVQCNIGDINMADYLFYLEPSYENRWFYCFITNILYINDNVTEIHFIEDVFMTWCNDMTLGSSFVVRESTASDTKYSDLFDQSDFTNDGSLRSYAMGYVGGTNAKKLSRADILCVVTDRAVDDCGYGPNVVSHETTYAEHQGRLDKLVYYFCNPVHTAGLNAMATLIEKQQTDTSWNPFDTTPAYRVLAVFLVSRLALDSSIIDILDASSGQGNVVTVSPRGSSDFGTESVFAPRHLVYQLPQEQDFPLTISNIESSAFGGYVPKNNKLYSAPYMFLRVKNNWGDCVDFEPQHLTRSNGNFLLRTEGTFFTGESVNLYAHYDGQDGNTTYRLHKTPAPEIPFSYDTYAQWLSQNKLSLAFSGAKSIVNGVSAVYGAMGTATVPMNKSGRGIPTYRFVASQYNAKADLIGGVGNAVTSLGGTVGGAMSVRAQGQSTAGTDSAGISSRAEDNDCFCYEIMSISYTDAEAVDSYFTKYGYAINHIKSLSRGLNGRSRFHYVQTDNAVVKGDIPMYAKEMIKRMFDNGIRIWNKDYFLDYSNGNPLST